MADHIRTIDRMLQTRPIDMRALLRLATWGCAAAAALMMAVLTATTGVQRLTAAATSSDDPRAASPKMPDVAALLTARTTEVESTARRLSSAVSALTADRDRLIKRIASLERGLEDLTGSIKQKAAADPASLPAIASAAPAAAPAKQPPPQAASPAASAEAAPAAPAEPAPAKVANVVDAPQAAEPKTEGGEFGIDVGGATTFDGLRALWRSVRGAAADMLEDLHPMVAARENRTRGVELRLIVGPIASTEAATKMCATLLAARRFCQMTLFEGQPLPQSVPEPGRRPATAPTRSSQRSRPQR
jgi:hypothetical protein